MSSVPGDRWYRLSPEIEQPKKYQPEPSTMNRQVIPSMILSVLIVCSFAIVLFERDPDAAGRKPDPGPAANKSTPPSASPSPGLANAGAARLAEPATAGARTPGQETAVTTEPPPQAKGPKERASDPAPAPVRRRRSRAERASARGDRRRPALDGDRAGGRRTSAASPSTAPASTVPRAAYTVVQKGETLKDVAVRVYGSSDRLDSLWRANRDVLPRSDSPSPRGPCSARPGNEARSLVGTLFRVRSGSR